MESKQKSKVGPTGLLPFISENFKHSLPEGDYEIAFRRWLVREINEGTLTISEAAKQFGLNRGRTVLSTWIKKYTDPHELPLGAMSPEEKAQKQADAKRIKELEKKLETTSMHVKALNTLIDIAEEQFKISIRKKSGTKQ